MALADPHQLLANLTASEAEAEWFEFKRGVFDPETFGEYVSALANSAMLAGKRHAFLIFGIDDSTHEIIGTNINLKKEKKGNGAFEMWLQQMLDPKINVSFETCFVDDKRVEIVCIEPAFDRPVKFSKVAYIRVGSNKTKLENYPEKERTLWALTNKHSYEKGLAATHYTVEMILSNFYCDKFSSIYYGSKVSTHHLIESLVVDGLIIDDHQGGYDITNLFAILAAKNLNDFETVRSKAPRVIVFKGKDKLHTLEDETGRSGYAVAFSSLLKHVMNKVSGKEIFLHGVRRRETFYPEIAVREFLANALIHQDLLARGSCPTVEIYSDRMVIHNLGRPFVEPTRIIDAPPRSRNEQLASLMRRAGHCEERGSGYFRALFAIETENQAPPLFQNIEESYVVTLYKNTDFGSMSKDDRIRACYQHAVMGKIRNEPMNNGSLRKRLGLKDTQASQVSNIIGDATEAGLIKPLDVDQGNRVAKYLPFWA